MVDKLYHSAMNKRLDDWIGALCGTTGGGIMTTLLSINLQTATGVVYFLLSSFFAGLLGYLARKIGELFWNKITTKKNEIIHQVDPDGERNGDFE